MLSNLLPHLTIPNILLVCLLILAAWVFMVAQASPKFDTVEMLLDESGKASSSRFAVFIALGLSTYLLSYAFINKSISDDNLLYMFGVYIVTWAGSKTLEKAVEGWGNRGFPMNSTRTAQADMYQYPYQNGYNGGYMTGGYTPPPQDPAARYPQPNPQFTASADLPKKSDVAES